MKAVQEFMVLFKDNKILRYNYLEVYEDGTLKNV